MKNLVVDWLSILQILTNIVCSTSAILAIIDWFKKDKSK